MQLSVIVGFQRLFHNLAGDRIDPNSFIHNVVVCRRNGELRIIVRIRSDRHVAGVVTLSKYTSVCQHLSSLTARLSVLVFLKARLSDACRCLTVVRLRSSGVGHPRPSLSGTGVPWVFCLDPLVCLRVQDDPEAKSQPVVVLG